MSNRLLNEVNRLRELMGVRVLNEQANVLDDILEFAKTFQSKLNIVKPEFSDAMKLLDKHKNGLVNLTEDELQTAYAKLANSYPEVMDELAPKIIQNLDNNLKTKIQQFRQDINDFKNAGATEQDVHNYINTLFQNRTIDSPIEGVTELLKKDFNDYTKSIFGTRTLSPSSTSELITLRPQDLPTVAGSDLDRLQKLYRTKGSGSLLNPILKMRQGWKDFFSSSVKLMDETLALTKTLTDEGTTILQKNDILKRISSNIEELSKKNVQNFEDYKLWLETYVKPTDYKMYEKIVGTPGYNNGKDIFSGAALKEYEKTVLTFNQRKKLLSEQIKDVIYPSRWFGKNMLSKMKAAGKDAKVGKWEKWGKLLNPNSTEFAELRRWLTYGGTRTPRQYVEYGNKLGWLGLGKDVFLNYIRKILWWNLWITVLDYVTDLASIPLSQSDWDFNDIMKKQYASYLERGEKELFGWNLEAEKDDNNLDSLAKFMARAAANFIPYYTDNLFEIQTFIPGLADDAIALAQQMTRKLTPEELKQLGLKAEELKTNAKQELQKLENEIEKQTGKKLPVELKDTTILDW